MRQTISFKAEYLHEGQKLLVYGAGIFGEIAWGVLRKIGIKIDYYIDKEEYGKKFNGIDVISPSRLSEFKEDVFLIASSNYFGEMLTELINQGANHIYDMYDLMCEDIDACDMQISEYAIDEMKNPFRYLFAVNKGRDDSLILQHCVINVTEKCSLNCRDCATLMQYYKKQQDISAEYNIKCLSNFFKVFDRLNELRILGGEPFLSPDLDVFLEWVLNSDQIDMISFYTNSTILPKDNILKLLVNDKITVHLSDYGTVSRQLEKFKAECEKRGIRYYVHKYDEWIDYGNLDKRNRTKEQNSAVFSTCGMSACYTFYRGKFFVCGRCPHGESVGAFVNPKTDFVDFNESDFDVKEKREEVNKLLKLSVLEACDYCNGGNIHSKLIPAAVQQPRSMNKYFD